MFLLDGQWWGVLSRWRCQLIVLSSFTRQTASTSQIYSNFLKPLGSIDRALFVLSLVHSKPRWLGHRADGSTGRMSWRQVSTGCDERNTPGQAKAQIQYIGKMGSWDKMMPCQNYSCGRNLPSSKMFLIYLFNVYNSDCYFVCVRLATHRNSFNSFTTPQYFANHLDFEETNIKHHQTTSQLTCRTVNQALWKCEKTSISHRFSVISLKKPLTCSEGTSLSIKMSKSTKFTLDPCNCKDLGQVLSTRYACAGQKMQTSEHQEFCALLLFLFFLTFIYCYIFMFSHCQHLLLYKSWVIIIYVLCEAARAIAASCGFTSRRTANAFNSTGWSRPSQSTRDLGLDIWWWEIRMKTSYPSHRHKNITYSRSKDKMDKPQWSPMDRYG